MTSTEVSTTRNQPANVPTRSPRVEVSETDEAIWLSADMPGVSRDDVSVELDDGVLTIVGDVAASGSRPARRFRRQFTISDQALFDLDTVEAKMAHGVLEVRLPKMAKPQARQIKISAA